MDTTQDPMVEIAQLRAELELERNRSHRLEKDNERLRVENADLKVENADLKLEARCDPLTGLLNRSGMRHRWDELQALWSGGNAIVNGIVMCDSDRFKDVNDSYDHRTGDIVLCKLADILRQAAPKQTIVRTGGDEFLVIVANDGQAFEPGECDPIAIAERIRELADTTMSVKGHSITTSFSIGVAAHPLLGIRMVDLIDAADHATIRSKRTGRNRVSVTYMDDPF
jgi:diguanylate cyclase (GGDEF)-like protein